MSLHWMLNWHPEACNSHLALNNQFNQLVWTKLDKCLRHLKNEKLLSVAFSIVTCSCDRWDNVLGSWVRWARCCPPPEWSISNIVLLQTLYPPLLGRLLLSDTFLSALYLPRTSMCQDKKPARLVPYQTHSHCALEHSAVAVKEIDQFDLDWKLTKLGWKFRNQFYTFPFCLFFFFAIEGEAMRRNTLIRAFSVAAKKGKCLDRNDFLVSM